MMITQLYESAAERLATLAEPARSRYQALFSATNPAHGADKRNHSASTTMAMSLAELVWI